MHSPRPWLDFGAGMLIGLAIVAALFAAMEETDGLSSYRLLLAAAGALGAGVGLRLAARTKVRGSAASAPAGPRRDAAALDAGRTASGPDDGATRRSLKAARDSRSAAARRNTNAVHRGSRGPATADGETRRL